MKCLQLLGYHRKSYNLQVFEQNPQNKGFCSVSKNPWDTLWWCLENCMNSGGMEVQQLKRNFCPKLCSSLLNTRLRPVIKSSTKFWPNKLSRLWHLETPNSERLKDSASYLNVLSTPCFSAFRDSRYFYPVLFLIAGPLLYRSLFYVYRAHFCGLWQCSSQHRHWKDFCNLYDAFGV